MRIIFLTILIDLIGFSIIFPLFPSLVKYYLAVDSNNFFLSIILKTVANVSGENINATSSIIIFGGIIGSLYSILQFIFSSFWGTLSDNIGRKTVLMISAFGLMLSYILWFFSGSFTTFLLSRILAGIMSGNISTATAVISDITNKENRSGGMAVIGIAFALGFIAGPGIGGILFNLNLVKYFPSLLSFGINPFSTVALFALLLSFGNFFFILLFFKESRFITAKNQVSPFVFFNFSNIFNLLNLFKNIFKIFKPLPYPGANLTNMANLVYLAIFSGMEFTLVFLADERLKFSAQDNAYLFVFSGILVTIIQGGFVRKRAGQIGEKKLTSLGFFLLIPSLVIIGLANSAPMLYLGLAILSTGSAFINPCLVGLASLYSPPDHQGHSLGFFRSFGALARAIGPITATILYWQLGSTLPYLIGATVMLIPLVFVFMLPEVSRERAEFKKK